MEEIVSICIMLGSLHAYSIVHCLDHACAVGGCMYIALENTDKQQGNNKLLVIGQIIMKEFYIVTDFVACYALCRCISYVHEQSTNHISLEK